MKYKKNKEESFISRLQRRLQQFLLLRELRIIVGFIRYFYYFNFKKQKKYFAENKEYLGKDTLGYNFERMSHSIINHDRVHHIIRPVLSVEKVAKNIPYLKTLSIGPRSEGELLLIAGYGFTWNNILGVDLFSYSPKIDVADMHDMPYKDNSFDIIFSGWTLAYSDAQEMALKEMVRVLKPGGFIAFGQGYTDMNSENRKSYVGTAEPKNTIDEIFAPIKESIDEFYFRHDVTEEMSKEGCKAIIAVFSIKKED